MTLKEESVIYATSRQSAEARRTCSLTIYQTICVGTQGDWILKRRKTKNEYQVSVSEHVIHYEV
ncbi:hypothetical protein BK796_16275 [Kosakonia pseudosacchari]|uniref:Uncharacterized protein n=1 Tax=Kosakonia pseudosacchari TaxID=1646340 RepID=A0ABX4IMP0_9ENTR|nr:hypothetical protein BK796_16275 [Kosakonia pseudosacchari]